MKKNIATNRIMTKSSFKFVTRRLTLSLILAVTLASLVSLSTGRAQTVARKIVNYVSSSSTVKENKITGDSKKTRRSNSQTLESPTSGGCATTSFTSPLHYSVGVSPESLAIADFNGDNKPDIVSISRGLGTASMLLGNGNGTFQNAYNFAVGDGPMYIVAADFNNDNKADIATANIYSDHVGVLAGNGNGTFQPANYYYMGPNGPNAISVGHFTNDTNLDMVVSNFGGGGFWILRGNGNATFQNPVLYPGHRSDHPQGITAADFNNDNKLDVALSNSGDDMDGPIGHVSMRLGNGDGTFQSAVNHGAGNYPFKITSGDFNGDNKMDIATIGRYTDAQVLFGNGNGTFQNVTFLPSGQSANVITSGDINGDGKTDIVVANWGQSNNVTILLSNGDGSFQSPASYGGLSGPFGMALGDLNSDGKTDVTVANLESSKVSVFTSNCVSACTPPSISQPPTSDSVTVGNSKTFSVTAAGNNLTYQWRKSGVDIQGATGSSYTINSVTSDDAGNYDVVITGECGNLTSSAATLTVNKANSTTTLGSSQNSSVFGQPVTFTATVAAVPQGAVAPSGIVEFRDGGNPIPSCTRLSILNGQAECITSVLTAGNHTITVHYDGDDNFNGSASLGTQHFVTSNTTTVITSDNADPSARNEAVTVKWTVTPDSLGAALTGNVTVTDGVNSCNAAVSVGECPITLTKAGARTLTASYSGDTNYNLSVSDDEPHAVKSLIPVDFDGDWISDYAVVSSTMALPRASEKNTREEFVLGGDILASERQRVWEQSYNKLLNLRSGRGFVELPKEVQAAINEQAREESATQKADENQTVEAGLGLQWKIRRSSDGTLLTCYLGLPTDVFVPADYDGDSLADAAVWNSTTGFTVINSSNLMRVNYPLGVGDVNADPTVIGDYDGDGRIDPAIYDKTTGKWSFLGGANHDVLDSVTWMSGGVAAPGDYNGDGKYDFAIQLPPINTPDTAKFRIAFNDGSVGPGADFSMSYGSAVYAIVPGDYDGDGKTDIAQANMSGTNIVWRVLTSSSNYTTQLKRTLGVVSIDRTAQGDYDGDSKIDFAIFRASAIPDDGLFIVFRSGNSVTSMFDWGEENDNPLGFFNTH